MHRTRNRTLAALTIALLIFSIYYALAARAYFTPPPAPTTNRLTAFNAALPQAPESDHAAPAYIAFHQAWEAAKPDLADPLPYDYWDTLRPGHPDFARIAATIRTLEPQLEAARHAAALPVLGSRLIPATPEQLALRNQPPVDQAMADSMINAFIFALSETSTTIRLLTIDAEHAASTNDPARFTANIHAALAAARHIRDVPLFINDIVAIRAVARTAELIRHTLHDHPDLLGATDLAALQSDLTDTARHHAILRLDTEVAGIADLFDRTFSPGPRGRITAAGIERLSPMFQFSDPTQTVFASIPDPRSPLAPLQARLVAPRAKQLALYTNYIEQAQAAQSAGPEAVANFQSNEYTLLMHDDLSGRYAPIQRLIPAMSAALITELRTRFEAEATITALAVQRYRRDHARLPDTLDQLVPTYLTTIPADPDDLTPDGRIKYLPAADTFTLYYNGANGQDDNATPPALDPNDPYAARRFHTGRTHPSAPIGDWIIHPPQP
jgi:hypothetical protein